MSDRVVQSLCVSLFLMSAVLLSAADSQYAIKEGETLFSVARKAQVPVDILSAYNGISDAAKVKVGTIIRVPVPYTVKRGDTLFGIARSFSVSLGKILDLNRLPQDARIRVGDHLFIPSDASGGAPQQQSAQQSGQQAQTTGTNLEGMPPSAQTALVWPHTGKREPIKGKITGLVIHGAAGDVVHSATSGEVKWAASYWGLGKIVIIKSGNGTIFTYGGNEELLVNVGDRVGPGTDIARLGESPQGGGAKLYFSIKDANGQVVDPEKFFSAKS